MTPNSVSALAYRAREGLRQAYLQQHLPTLTRPDCRTVAPQLAAWVRRRQPTHRMRRVSTHLNGCPPCQALAKSLTKLNDELPTLLAPILLGAPAATAYLTTTTASTGLALAAKTGAATAPWITALKTTVAGAMIITTATTVASDPVPDAREPHVALAPPAPVHPAAPTNPTRPHTPTQSSPGPTSAISTATPLAATQPTATTAAVDPAITDKQATKAAKQATKAEAKAAKAEAKAEAKAKATKKAEKKAAKGK